MTDQLTLIDGESDEALLVPYAEAAKRYTGKTAEKQEGRRRHILDLLAFNMPVDIVAARCQCSARVVKLLGAKYANEVAQSVSLFAPALKGAAAEFLWLAKQKAPDAKFGELMVGVGIATQRAEEMEARAAGTLDASPATDVAVVDEKVLAAQKWLAEKNPPKQLAEAVNA